MFAVVRYTEGPIRQVNIAGGKLIPHATARDNQKKAKKAEKRKTLYFSIHHIQL